LHLSIFFVFLQELSYSPARYLFRFQYQFFEVWYLFFLEHSELLLALLLAFLIFPHVLEEYSKESHPLREEP
jgi:hypothetical protein